MDWIPTSIYTFKMGTACLLQNGPQRLARRKALKPFPKTSHGWKGSGSNPMASLGLPSRPSEILYCRDRPTWRSQKKYEVQGEIPQRNDHRARVQAAKGEIAKLGHSWVSILLAGEWAKAIMNIRLNRLTIARPVTRGRSTPYKIFRPPGKMCWA